MQRGGVPPGPVPLGICAFAQPATSPSGHASMSSLTRPLDAGAPKVVTLGSGLIEVAPDHFNPRILIYFDGKTFVAILVVENILKVIARHPFEVRQIKSET